jgi:hypothetical protein
MAKKAVPMGAGAGDTLQPGMNNPQRDADSKAWKVEPAMFFGGVFEEPTKYSGPVVGNPYDADMMGETREMITYPAGAMPGKTSK